jgi:hypothetical protein
VMDHVTPGIELCEGSCDLRYIESIEKSDELTWSGVVLGV